MKKFVRIMSMVLALTMLFSLTACGNKQKPNPPVIDKNPTVATEAPADETNPDITVENPVTFFSMSMGENYDDVRSLTAFANEDGTIYVEYVADEKKVGDLDSNIFHGIAAELEKTELASLNGADNYADGEANAAMYIEFADGTVLSVNYTGEISEAFANGYAIMDDYFKKLTADLDVYVPQPQIMGEVDEEMLNEVLAIINGSNLPNVDGIAITSLDINDEFFGGSAGLSSNEGIANAVSAAPMMMSQAYSLVIVELEDVANAETISADFEKNVDWMKWVCVAPTNALIATKGNMVLCLQAANEMYELTVAGIEAAGWTQVNELDNPNM